MIGKSKLRVQIKQVLLICVIGIVIVIAMFPLAWILLTSLKSRLAIQTYPPVLIFKPVLDNYYKAFVRSNYLSHFVDSIIISLSSTGFSIFIGSLAAYGIARFNVGGRNFSFWILSMRMFPPIAIVLPLYLLMREFHLLDTYFALIISYTTFNTAFTVWLMAGFFKDIPKELDESAMIDGCSLWGAFWRIILPISRPGLVATSIFCLIMSWNEFLFALILTGVNVKTVPVAIAEFVTDREIFWGPMCATGVLASLPIVIFAMLIQKHLVRGLTLGAVK